MLEASPELIDQAALGAASPSESSLEEADQQEAEDESGQADNTTGGSDEENIVVPEASKFERDGSTSPDGVISVSVPSSVSSL